MADSRADSRRICRTPWHPEGKFRQAEKLRRRQLALHEQFGSVRSPEAALAASGLATVLDDAGKHAEPESLHRHAVEYLKQFPGYEANVVANPRRFAKSGERALAGLLLHP
jgi:hypothetical protein